MRVREVKCAQAELWGSGRRLGVLHNPVITRADEGSGFTAVAERAEGQAIDLPSVLLPPLELRFTIGRRTYASPVTMHGPTVYISTAPARAMEVA